LTDFPSRPAQNPVERTDLDAVYIHDKEDPALRSSGDLEALSRNRGKELIGRLGRFPSGLYFGPDGNVGNLGPLQPLSPFGGNGGARFFSRRLLLQSRGDLGPAESAERFSERLVVAAVRQSFASVVFDFSADPLQP